MLQRCRKQSRELNLPVSTTEGLLQGYLLFFEPLALHEPLVEQAVYDQSRAQPVGFIDVSGLAVGFFLAKGFAELAEQRPSLLPSEMCRQ